MKTNLAQDGHVTNIASVLIITKPNEMAEVGRVTVYTEKRILSRQIRIHCS